MDVLLILVQAIVASLCFTIPGLLLLQRIGGKPFANAPAAYQLAASFIASSLMIAALQAVILTFLPALAATLIAWLLLLVCLGLLFRRTGTHIASVGKGPSLWEKRTWMLVAGLLFSWLLMMPLSPYPALLDVELGDRPGYYRLITNLVSGRGWNIDFFVGDYIGGKPAYLTSHPLPVLNASLLFQIVGINDHSLSIYNALAGAITVLLVATFVTSAKEDNHQGPTILVIALLTLFVPAAFQLFALGVVTVASALAALLATVMLIDTRLPKPARLLICAMSLLVMLLSRPEAAVLAVLIVAGYGLLNRLLTPLLPRSRRLTLGVILAATLAVGWTQLPTITRMLPANFKNLSVFYLRYDTPTNSFAWIHAPWWHINKEMSRTTFSGDPNLKPEHNPEIGTELREHPAALAHLLVRQFQTTLHRLVGSVELDSYTWPSPIPKNLAAFVICLALIPPRNRALVAIVLIALFFMPLLNVGFSTRHMLPYALILFALSAYTALSHTRQVTRLTTLIVPLIILSAHTMDILSIRTARSNTDHQALITDLQDILQPGQVLATSYPQLMAHALDCKAVGSTWLADDMPGIIARFNPDLIALDDSREGPRNYTTHEKEHGLNIQGYTLTVHNKGERYAIFTRNPAPQQ